MQGPSLSTKVPIVSIGPLDWKLHGNNQSMSNSVFSVCSYILVLRLRLIKSSKVSNWLTLSKALLWWCYGMLSNCVCVMWFWFMAHSFPTKRVAFFHVASQKKVVERRRQLLQQYITERAASFFWSAEMLSDWRKSPMRLCVNTVRMQCSDTVNK